MTAYYLIILALLAVSVEASWPDGSSATAWAANRGQGPGRGGAPPPGRQGPDGEPPQARTREGPGAVVPRARGDGTGLPAAPRIREEHRAGHEPAGRPAPAGRAGAGGGGRCAQRARGSCRAIPMPSRPSVTGSRPWMRSTTCVSSGSQGSPRRTPRSSS